MGNPSKTEQLKAGNSVRVWLTRNEVLARLRISYSRLLTYERYGWLTKYRAADVGYRSRGGNHGGRPPAVVYDLRQVDDIGRRRRIMRRASAAQRAFAAFDRGQGVVQVVVELGIDPDLARDLYRDYAIAAGGVYLPGELVDELRRLGFDVTAATFPDVVRNLLAAARGRTPRPPRGVRFLADTGEKP